MHTFPSALDCGCDGAACFKSLCLDFLGVMDYKLELRTETALPPLNCSLSGVFLRAEMELEQALSTHSPVRGDLGRGGFQREGTVFSFQTLHQGAPGCWKGQHLYRLPPQGEFSLTHKNNHHSVFAITSTKHDFHTSDQEAKCNSFIAAA